ncbi:MAG TPA: DUF2225 domain-containing protein [Candidatus Ozemobacteraceae bacterium]|nr:DUF2225 domain-containing protein [Candidatus Ozemobacteraceae bacterium]
MTTRLALQHFRCPTCLAEFDANIVEAVSHQGQDSDFYPHYIGEDPLEHFLVQCPTCLFCAYPDDYAKTDDVEAISQERIREILEQPLAKKLPRVAQMYYLAGKLYEYQKKNPYHIGNLYLRGSWVCRKSDNRKAEIEMQQLAVKFLRVSVERSTVANPDNLPVVTYLVGELYRRLEDKSQAREWLNSVEEVLIDQDQQWLLELAKKQAELNEHFIN